MLSREEVKQDLEQLKQIVIRHKRADAPLATSTKVIGGIEQAIFTKIPETLHDLYRLGLETPDSDFLVYQQERFSFGETFELACKLARLLTGRYGIVKGDRVAICSRNNPQWCIAYMATTLIGAIAVPMNSWWTGPELEYGLEDSGTRLLFADQDRISRIAPYLDLLDLDIIAINPGKKTDFPEFNQLINEENEHQGIDLNKLNIVADDDATIMYTSGSTGHPKGVLSTHRNITHALYSWLFAKEINEILRPELLEEDPEFEHAILANVPLFHVTGSHAQFLASFVNQRKFVMMYKWDVEVALKLIEQERITVFMVFQP